jgi:hypothetical protein
LQASEHTPEELKIVLLRYLNTNQGAPDSMDIIPFLLERIRNEVSSDNARACAVLCLNTQFKYVIYTSCKTTAMILTLLLVICSSLLHSWAYGNETKFQAARKLLAEAWGAAAGHASDAGIMIPRVAGKLYLTHFHKIYRHCPSGGY